MAFKRHFARVGAAERCTESIFTDHQRQVCDYALVYAEKKNDGDAPYSLGLLHRDAERRAIRHRPDNATAISCTHSQLERAVRHERQAQATELPASASPAAPPAWDG